MNRHNGIYTARCQFGETVVGACWWWLRSPGNNSNNAANVNNDGNVNNNGNNVNNDNNSVRPVVVALTSLYARNLLHGGQVCASEGREPFSLPGRTSGQKHAAGKVIRHKAVHPWRRVVHGKTHFPGGSEWRVK